MFVYGSKIPCIKSKCSENVIEYFSHSKDEMAKRVSTKKIFQQFYNLRYSKIKKVGVQLTTHQNNWYLVIDSQVCQKFRPDYYSDHKKK